MAKHKPFVHLKKRFKKWISSPPQSQIELLEQLKTSVDNHLINLDTFTMLQCVIEFANMQVRDIVVPKPQMVNISQDASLAQIIRTVSQSGHSRFPVTGEYSDEIIGILHAKDLLSFQNPELKDFDLRDLLRIALFVPESKRLLTLLNEFQKNRNHMAIVVDEYGAVNGLVTIEDIIEQIIGEIEDEFDIDEEILIKHHGKHRYTLKGHTPIELFNETLHTNFSDEAFDTIAGLITNACGHLPKQGEVIHIEGFQFKILHADERRVQLLACNDKRSKWKKTI